MKFGSITTNIIVNGLVYNVDPANRASYPRTGTTVKDTIGNINGSLDGATFQSTLPLSFNFDGVDDKIDFTSTLQSSTTTDLSINTWIKTNDKTLDSGAYRGWFTGGPNGSGTTAGFKMAITNDNGYAVIWGLNNTAQVTGTTAIDTDMVVNVVYTYTTGTGKLYINGVLNATATYTGNHDMSAYFIGSGGTSASSLSSQGMFNGDIGPVQVYNRALLATEVMKNFNALKDRMGYVAPITVTFLVVAGGGGSMGGYVRGVGGGGAGGLRTSFGSTSGGGASAESNITALPGTSYTVTIGAGGAGPANATNAFNLGNSGNSSVFASITSIGGGRGGSGNNGNGSTGGSAGGHGGTSNNIPTSGTTGQGTAGGTNSNSGIGAGGGGASTAGTAGASGGTGGNGFYYRYICNLCWWWWRWS